MDVPPFPNFLFVVQCNIMCFDRSLSYLSDGATILVWTLSDAEHSEREGAPHEDARLLDYRVKRGPAQRSKIFGAWVADKKTENCDRPRHSVIATSRDKVLFKKLLEADMVFRESEIYGVFVGLTKKSGKELNEKNFSAEERKMFDGAKVVEIENLTNQNAIEFVATKEKADRARREEEDRIVPSRFVLTNKRQEIGGKWRAKARWILLRHRDPDALEMDRLSAAPTVMLAYQILASMRYRLLIMDVTTAFGQSDPQTRPQGNLYASLPTSGIPGRPQWSIIWVVNAVYGLVNAPSSWRKTVVRYLITLGFHESVYDPCLFFLPFDEADKNAGAQRGCAGLVLLDVDDFAKGGNERHGRLMEELRGRFRFGKWREVYKYYGEYLGRTVRQLENFEIRVDMERYIVEKLKPVVFARRRLQDGDDAHLTEHEVSLLRGAAGSLLWVGKECRPDCGAACAMSMSWGSKPPTIRHVKAANKAISELQRTAKTFLRKPQGGFIVAYVDKTIMDGELVRTSIRCWKSHKLRRVVKASLGSEAAHVMDASRYGPDLSAVAVRQPDPQDPTIMVTDARALYDLYNRRSGAAGLDRRAQIDVAVLATSAKVLGARVFWLPGLYMLADALTKRLGNSQLARLVMALGLYGLSCYPSVPSLTIGHVPESNLDVRTAAATGGSNFALSEKMFHIKACRSTDGMAGSSHVDLSISDVIRQLREQGVFQRVWRHVMVDLAWRQKGQKCAVGLRGTESEGRWLACEPWEYHLTANFSSVLPSIENRDGLVGDGLGKSNIAVCVLGAPRTVVKTYESIREKVVDTLKGDAFIYVPFSGTFTPALEEDLRALGRAVTAIVVPDVDRTTFEAYRTDSERILRSQAVDALLKGEWALEGPDVSPNGQQHVRSSALEHEWPES
ncbi:GIP [Symbiodinium sp. CCMP2592]|nr:GIP [Symbiodinium sp. CCMP2592]